MGTMKRLYEELSLGTIEDAETGMTETARRLASHAGHRPPPGPETMRDVME